MLNDIKLKWKGTFERIQNNKTINIQQREKKKNKVNWIWKNIFFPHTDRQYHILIIAIGEITWNAICVFSTISIQATFSKNLCV